ncbi:MAG: S8 family serine peptidase [Bacteroidales bacterium]|nr:S8 family serine peptidase [Bacteroidales bacterium]
MRFHKYHCFYASFFNKWLRLAAIFAVALFLHTEAFSQYKPVVRGERPPIDLNKVPEDAYDKGVIRIKFHDFMAKSLEELEPGRTENGAVTMGIAGLDMLNTQFSVRDVTQTFNSPALNNNYKSRHELWGFHLWYDLWVDESTDIIAMVKAYMQLDEVAFAEPHYSKELIGNVPNEGEVFTYTESEAPENRDGGTLFPNDPQFGAQWHYHNTGQTGGLVGADISLPEAWTLETGNVEVIVAVVDGGIGITHPDLAGNIWEGVGYNFVSNSPTIIPHDHGSHVAGTIAAVSNNNVGVSGIAGGWGSSQGVALMSAQVFEPGWGQSGGFAVAPIYAADNGAAISQNSWGYTSSGFYEQAVLDAIDYFNVNGGGDVMDGGLTIFAAGNSSNSGPNYPGYYSGAKAVAATNHNDQLAWYSNFGSHIDLSAPGGETNTVTAQGVLSTLNSGYGHYQGTSMACPHVSGVVALLLSMAPGEFSSDEIWEMVVSTTDNIYPMNPGYLGQLGTGRVNAFAALQELLYHMADPDAPAAPAEFEVIADQTGGLSSNLSWINPVESASGEPLSALDTIHIYRNNEPITFILNPVMGESGSYTDNNIPEAGFYTYSVRGANFAGTGLAASATVYVGHDVPAAPENIVLTPTGDHGQLTWEAPQQGMNNGFFDGSNLSYTIVRFPDETEVAAGVTANAYLDTEVPNVGNFFYEITAVNHIGTGGTDASNVATLGAEGLLIYEPFDLPAGTLPTGWVIEGLGQTQWSVHNSNTAGGEAPQMRFNWSPSFTGVSRLLTHAVNIEGISQVGFSYRNFLRNYGSSAGEITVQYSVTNGESWVDLWSYNGTADFGPVLQEFEIDIPGGTQYIQFAFKWDGYTWDIWDWNIDDVILEALSASEHYSVAFEVFDSNGEPVHDAVVSINGIANEPGDYFFPEVSQGTHSFVVEASCFLPYEDSFTLTNQDKEVELYLENHTGDANADGVVNVLDVILIANYFINEDISPFCFNNADVNEDGIIDVLDVIGTMNIFLDGNASPNPALFSATAGLFMHPDRIVLESDGTLAGLQFELTGNVPEKASVNLLLEGYQLLMAGDGERLKALIFSTDQLPIPEGTIDILSYEMNEDLPEWGDVKAGNLNAEEVPVIVHRDMPTGMDDADGPNSLTVFPNPAQDVLWAEVYKTGEGTYRISLINLLGHQVKTLDITQPGKSLVSIDVQDLPAGMYFIRLQKESDTLTTRVLIR